MNQRWRAEDAIRAEWGKDSRTVSSLIFFVIDTASRFAFRLQQERMGDHVHRASWCQNNNKKKDPPNEHPFPIAPLPLPLLSAPSVFPSIPLILHSVPPTLLFKIEVCTVEVTVCGNRFSLATTLMTVAYSTFQVGLNLIGTKARYFPRKLQQNIP